MIQVRPVFGKDYKPGTVLFTAPVKPGFVSAGIIWFQKMEETDDPGLFIASHVSMVIDEFTGVESAENGYAFFPLSRYFDNDEYRVVCREPIDMTVEDAEIAISVMSKGVADGKGYGFTDLFGYLGKVLSPLDNIFPALNKLPVPLHIPGTAFCSAAVAQAEKAVPRYATAVIFQKYHYTRVSPARLWSLFPFKPFSFSRQREALA